MELYDFSHVKTFKLTVGTTATQAVSANVASGLINGKTMFEVSNTSSSDIFFGGEDVTVDTGIKIPAGANRIFPSTRNRCPIYLIAAAATDVVLAEYFD